MIGDDVKQNADGSVDYQVRRVRVAGVADFGRSKARISRRTCRSTARRIGVLNHRPAVTEAVPADPQPCDRRGVTDGSWSYGYGSVVGRQYSV